MFVQGILRISDKQRAKVWNLKEQALTMSQYLHSAVSCLSLCLFLSGLSVDLSLIYPGSPCLLLESDLMFIFSHSLKVTSWIHGCFCMSVSNSDNRFRHCASARLQVQRSALVGLVDPLYHFLVYGKNYTITY